MECKETLKLTFVRNLLLYLAKVQHHYSNFNALYVLLKYFARLFLAPYPHIFLK